jgi:hypothetical protein
MAFLAEADAPAVARLDPDTSIGAGANVGALDA